MKSPFQYKWFCFVISLMSAYFIYIDLTKDNKVNFLNLLWFIGSTYLFFCHKSEKYNKNLIVKKNENNELKIQETFKK